MKKRPDIFDRIIIYGCGGGVFLSSLFSVFGLNANYGGTLGFLIGLVYIFEYEKQKTEG